MPKPEDRGSLIGLRTSLPTLPKVPAVRTTPEMERGMRAEPEPARNVQPERSTDVKTSVSTAPALEPSHSPARPKKEPTVLMNAKLPVSLHTRLKRTAQFNDVSMTDILIRAIEVELASGRYTPPPDAWGVNSAGGGS